MVEHRGWSLSAEDAQYLQRISVDLVLAFICRHCGGYGECWLKALTRYHFRCCFCGSLFRPWAKGATTSPYNKVLIYKDPVSGIKTMIPCKWPATAADNYIMGLAEAHARQIKTPQDLDDFRQRKQVALGELIARAGVPDHYVHREWNRDIEFRLSPPEFGPEVWADMKTKGFWGGQWRPENHKSIQVFSAWEELATLIGELLVATRAP